MSGYYSNPREDILRRVPASARRVLDIGCGAGALGAGIRRRQNAVVVGVEFVPEQAAKAAQLLDAVHTGDAASVPLPYAPGSFDCLVFADVLEHTADPWALLARYRELLAPGGTLVVSLPNVQFAGVLAGLARGRWEYRDRGVLDRTHLRFFTRATGRALLEGAGFEIIHEGRQFRWFDSPASRLHRFARIVAPLPWLRDLFTYQFVWVARQQGAL